MVQSDNSATITIGTAGGNAAQLCLSAAAVAPRTHQSNGKILLLTNVFVL